MRTRAIAVLLAPAILLLLTPSVTSVALAANDARASAVRITTLPHSESRDIQDATTEPGEPVETCAPFRHTVWYAVTLTKPAAVSVDTAGSNFDTALAVWTGTGFSSFDLQACNDDQEDLQARVSFVARKGVTYWVQAGSFGNRAGILQIRFEETRRGGGPVRFAGQFRGRSADAYWVDEAASAYRETSAYVVEGNEKVFKERPYRTQDVFVDIYEERFANGNYGWTEWYGGTELSRDDFSISAKLDRASVNTQMTLFGERCVETEGQDPDGYWYDIDCTFLGTRNVRLTATWDGYGGLRQSSYVERYRSGSFHGLYRDTTTGREATAAGSFSGGIQRNLGSGFGFISRNGSSYRFQSRDGTGFFF